MALLAGTTYDPGTAVSKATTALLAMTALDTTNLRQTFVVPANGRVLVRIDGGALHGAATYPQILLGVLEGTTVRLRKAPQTTFMGVAAASTYLVPSMSGIVTGLSAGASLTWDAAYAVESIVAATGYKYGGPNTNATATDAFGGISFEIWSTD